MMKDESRTPVHPSSFIIHPYRMKPWVAGLALWLLCGCTALPLWRGRTNAPGTPTQPVVGQDANLAATGTTVVPRSLDRGQTVPRSGDRGTTGAVQPVGNDRVVEISQRLATAEDERRALTAQIGQLETALEERDRALHSIKAEIRAANEEVTRTRTELQRMKQETASCRERLLASEKENLTTLQAIVAMLEKFLERDKAPRSQAETGNESRENSGTKAFHNPGGTHAAYTPGEPRPPSPQPLSPAAGERGRGEGAPQPLSPAAGERGGGEGPEGNPEAMPHARDSH